MIKSHHKTALWDFEHAERWKMPGLSLPAELRVENKKIKPALIQSGDGGWIGKKVAITAKVC
jgi:hypothetical protein